MWYMRWTENPENVVRVHEIPQLLNFKVLMLSSLYRMKKKAPFGNYLMFYSY